MVIRIGTGVRSVGVQSILFDYGEDSGPIIGQKAFEIDGDDTVETIKKKG